MNGDITLAGVTLTLEEWETLDKESQELLLSLAVGPPEDTTSAAERTVQIPAMVDLLSTPAAART